MHPNDLVRYRSIPWQRKASSWDAPLITNAAALAEVAEHVADGSLPEYESTETWPCSDIRDGRIENHTLLVAVRPNGDRFLVNTEGYTYARYIARLPTVMK